MNEKNLRAAMNEADYALALLGHCQQNMSDFVIDMEERITTETIFALRIKERLSRLETKLAIVMRDIEELEKNL